MKIVFISDTHMLKPEIPKCDVLVHAGDATFSGSEAEVEKFAKWFLGTPATHRLFVPGNHDWLFQTDEHMARAIMVDGGSSDVLIDESITINNVKFYGSPWQPEFCNWAFNLSRVGMDLHDKWEAIPDDTDVLVTHGPPKDILDSCPDGRRVGCYDLRDRLKTLKPKIHCFGHIHHSYGEAEKDGTRYLNASVVNEEYKLANKPFEVEL